MSDPSFLVSTPTFTDPSLSPDGRQLRQVLFPAPNLAGARPIDWATEAPVYREHMLATLAARGLTVTGPGDGNDVLALRTPADWLAAGLAGGTPFAAAHTVRQTGPLRAATLDPHIENLLWCGANVQPGVGVPMALISGRLAAARVR
jgi:phytoene desaturase